MFNKYQNDSGEMHNLAKDPRFTDIIEELDKQLSKRLMETSIPPKGVTIINPNKKIA